MFVPSLKANESIYSYAYRLANANGMLSPQYFYKYIVLKNGKIANGRKLEHEIYSLIGENNSILFREVMKRKQGVLNNHKLISKVELASLAKKATGSESSVFEKYNMHSLYCPMCIKEQIYQSGHSWLKLDWLHSEYCHIHKTRLSNLLETSIKLKKTLYDTFVFMSLGHIDWQVKPVLKNEAKQNTCGAGVISPCLICDYFKVQQGGFDFRLIDFSASDLIGLLYQYMNNFSSYEKNMFSEYVCKNTEVCSFNNVYFYKSKKSSCLRCDLKEICLPELEDRFMVNVNCEHADSILENIFKESSLFEHVNNNSLKVYSDLVSYLKNYFIYDSYEYTTVNWILYLISSTFSSYTEFLSRNGGEVTFDNIRREPKTGLLVLKLRRERVNSRYRLIPLPRDFEVELKRYVTQCWEGIFDKGNPLVCSKTRANSILASEVNKMLREAFKSFDSLSGEGRNLHAIRDYYIASSIYSGSNIEYLTITAGLSRSPLWRLEVLPLAARASNEASLFE